MDRLIQHAEVIELEDDSYRLKEAKELNAARTKKRGPTSADPQTSLVNFTGLLRVCVSGNNSAIGRLMYLVVPRGRRGL